MYIRDAPPEVTERLERLAARERVSLNTYVLRELAEASRRADNAELLGVLPDLNIATEDIVAAIDEGRDGQ